MNVHLAVLRDALLRNKGNTLTDELCIGLEAVVMSTFPMVEDRAVALAGFDTMEYKGAVFAVERLRDVLEQVAPLHAAHWQESESFRHGLPYKPDYASMIASETAGNFVLFTVRMDGEIVGYGQVYVTESTHTGTKICNEDALYLAPVARKGFLCVKFFKYIESVITALGVREMRLSVKVTNEIWKLWERQGYARTGYELVKVF